jgi:hypothetical protein
MKLLVLPLALFWSYPPAKAPAPGIKLTGYFACSQSTLVPSKDALGCYAPTQRGCQHGTVVLAYERRLNPAGQPPRYLIADTVRVQLNAAQQYLTLADCTNAAGKRTQYFVLGKKKAPEGEYLHGILRVWGVNAHGQLVEVPPKTIKCLNDGFGA